MRLFIAVSLSAECRDGILALQNRLYGGGVRGRYSTEENLHLTLAFIGEYPDAGPVADALQAVRFTPFELALDGLGSFGDLWWVGVKDSGPLEAVARRVRRALSGAGIPFDRKKFSPHITILRKAALPRDAGAFLAAAEAETLEGARMTVSALSLFRSDRGKAGMIYTELARTDAQ